MTMTAAASCPTSVVNAPVETVWALLVRPEAWGEFYDLRIASVAPPGPAAVGQVVLAESGPRLLRLKLEFRFTTVDAANHRLGLDVRFPFGVTVREDLSCVPLGPERCRVNYRCDFGFPAGWRGAAVRFLMWRELDAGPADSLSRLQRAAERQFALGAGNG
jgi:hypothetical protein